MSDLPVWTRIHRRLRREIAARRHARFDEALRRRAATSELSDEEIERIALRITLEPGDENERGLTLSHSPASLKDAWYRQTPAGPAQAIGAAQELLADRITLFGVSFPLADPFAWHRDLSTRYRERASQPGGVPTGQRDSPARPSDVSDRHRAGRSGNQWPLKPHRQIRLVGPRVPGDVRMQWEAARFHHALLLGRGYLASGDCAHADAFQRQVDAFLAGNPPFRGIHWAVGMEVAIRAAAWVFTLEFLRGASALTREWSRAMVRHLLFHGLFLETHIERHPLGFTTNHTLTDYAGLAVLGRAFAGSTAGERWRALAAEGLAACLGEQVLPDGAHAEGSLAYERFVLEASLVAALCLDHERAEPLRPAIQSLARHLRGATLESGLPFVGDGDDSFFPPFACMPFADWDPFDPEAVLQVAADWCADPALRRRPRTEEPAFWLGVGSEGSDAPTATTPARPGTNGGCIQFTAGPFAGLLIARGSDERWLPTHGHNDLLSLVLEINAARLLIDPGTGAYGLDPRRRHVLRSTAAHSTLQLDECEQSPIDTRRLFEGPGAVPGGLHEGPTSPTGLPIEAWHDGFGGGFRHSRRISWAGDCLWIEDRLGGAPPGGADPSGRHGGVRDDSPHTSTLRFRLAPGLMLRGLGPPVGIPGLVLPPGMSVSDPADSQGDVPASRARLEIGGGETEFLLLRPKKALWQIGSGVISRRYGRWQDAPILQAQWSGPLPHCWVVGIRHRLPA